MMLITLSNSSYFTEVVVASTILAESFTLSCLPAYIEMYGNHFTTNRACEHVQPPLINTALE